MLKKLMLGLIIILMLGSVVGCSSTNKSNDSVSTVAVTDAKGNKMTIPKKPQRIISLNLSTDEILLDLVPKERIVAVSYLADDAGVSWVADKSKQIPNKVKGNSAEAIMKLKPDLVLIGDWWTPEFVTTLRELKVPVYSYKTPYSLTTVADSIREVAKLVGEEEQGEKMIAQYMGKIDAIKAKGKKIPADKVKRILPVATHGQLGSKGGMYDDMCTYINAHNVVADIVRDKANVLISKEQVITTKANTIVSAVWDIPNTQAMSKTKEEILSDPAYATLPAIKNKDVVEVQGKCFYCISQYVADSLAIFGKAVYPEYF